MPERRIHYRRRIRGTHDAWVHCGRALARTVSTTVLADVTCLTCAGYVAKGLAAGYRQSATAAREADEPCPH